MIRSLLLLTFLVMPFLSEAQYSMYFDGNDSPSIPYEIVPGTNNIWQVGEPNKLAFTSASSIPYAIVTDTINPYPPNNVSSFIITAQATSSWGILAIQWVQKLDLDNNGGDGGIVEYSVDTGQTWNNVFFDPYVYNFYGFDPANTGYLSSTGEYGFMGTDTTWKDVWLCFDVNSLNDTIQIRFTLKSDSSANSHDGWMIDNILQHNTIIHTINAKKNYEYMTVYPTVTTGELFIEAEKIFDYHVIENMELRDSKGAVVRRYGKAPTKFIIDIADLPPGMYILNVNTNLRSMTFPVFLKN